MQAKLENNSIRMIAEKFTYVPDGHCYRMWGKKFWWYAISYWVKKVYDC